MLTAGAVTAAAANSWASAGVVAPEALLQAQAIRAEVTARYRLVPGRELVVTEASWAGVVPSVTLVAGWLDPWRVVPTENGIYFALCPARATCPYPARRAAWPAAALLPRRQAAELALRTFLETSASLVVVALPTAEPLWLVFERDDLLAAVEAPAALRLLDAHPPVADAPTRELVRGLTRARLFAPIPVLPPLDDTILAVRVAEP